MLVGLWLLVANTAWGREPTIRLQWQGPPSCTDDGSVAQEIRRILGDSAAVASGQPLLVTATVTHTSESRWLVNLSTLSGELRGQRSLVAASCTEVRRATALIVALMVDPDVQLAASDPQQKPEPKPSKGPLRPVEPTGPQQRTGSGEPAPTTAAAGVPLVGLDAVAAVGTLPGGSAGARLTLGVGFRRLSIELSGTGWLTRERVSDEELDAGGRFSLWSGHLLACYDLFSGSLGLGGCLGAGARRMRGEGFGVSEPGSASGTWAALLTQWYASLPLTKELAFRAAAGTEFPFRPPTFNLAGLGRVYSPNSVAAELSMGLRLKF
jgi:hypothetical protein